MPRPAKPPMTLKEAKRAYKKDGGIVRYTASQMARADRIDAREAKRKKELEKEKQRAGNKRKREEKEEKERLVRQKMLEEGRITIEDTWGKVTASQPRLNRFFGRPVLTKGNKRTESTGDRDETPPTDTDCASSEEDDPKETEPTVVLPAVQGPPKTPDKETAGSSSHSHLSPSHRVNTALTELGPGHLNARSLAPPQPSLETKSSRQEKPRASPESSQCVTRPCTKPTTIETRPPSTNALRLTGNSLVDGGSTIELLGPNQEVPKATNKKCPDEQDRQPTPPEHKPPIEADKEDADDSFSTGTDEEDFTDGIDDATFLMLCASQKPVAADAYVHLPHKVSGPSQSSTLKPATGRSSTPVAPDLGLNNVEARAESVAASNSSRGLTESFTSMFAEIEDEDLIALAKEVEAELSTPQGTTPVAAEREASDNMSQTLPRPSAPHGNFNHHASSPLLTGSSTTARPVPSSAPNRELSRGNKPFVGPPESKSLAAEERRKVPPLITSAGLPPPLQRKQDGAPVARTRGPNPRAIGANPRTAGPNHPPKPLEPIQRPPKPATPMLSRPTTTITTTKPKPKSKRRLPDCFDPPDEFSDVGLGPATQAVALELLAQAEKRCADETRRNEKR